MDSRSLGFLFLFFESGDSLADESNKKKGTPYYILDRGLTK